MEGNLINEHPFQALIIKILIHVLFAKGNYDVHATTSHHFNANLRKRMNL